MCQGCYEYTDKQLGNKIDIKCHRCSGRGVYYWGAVVNGKPTKTGKCFACAGKGNQNRSDIVRETTYYNHRMSVSS